MVRCRHTYHTYILPSPLAPLELSDILSPSKYMYVCAVASYYKPSRCVYETANQLIPTFRQRRPTGKGYLPPDRAAGSPFSILTSLQHKTHPPSMEWHRT